ncbi:uracil-DNA glycosylase family protein [Shewanella psychropiezotolerans]|uniref:Uracil-DNA glycosylase family protein n=1 Tax=Shewanella psychropiezotolerans TaxID=2593655 RepID=A0ABX5X6R3_9GAMM|nr:MULTISPECIES: uracil-DNA glycosylase family protein [Shewanella]MPY21422.1 uracil-DNA glycosylase family protein [Shewanella sp. YLB-07]MPY22209.1 uracil-DNA glycosylase family protein [Shewanella sp. YLB-07]QDO84951.1 uracil-DNA glycosylase family protein [Shewanella psychropiezotolerans]
MKPSDKFLQLKAKISACNLCQAELPLPAKPIIQISQNAKILIAGQAPGIKAHEKGAPFHDPSGKRLRDWLGVTEEQFYDANLFAIVPMGFCFPGTIIRNGKKSGDKPPMPLCAPIWRQTLFEELAHIELTIILGQYAIDYHLNSKQGKNKLSVTQAVMNWQEYWPASIALPHPSPRNNIWLKRHPEFEAEVIPRLRNKVKDILTVQG